MIKKLNKRAKNDYPKLSPVVLPPAQGAIDKKSVNRLALPTLSGIAFKDIDSIVSLHASSNYTCVRFKSGEQIVVCKTLKDFEIRLHKHSFFRVHRSTIVNMCLINEYVRGQGGYLVMEDGTNVQVSKHRKNDFLEAIELYWV